MNQLLSVYNQVKIEQLGLDFIGQGNIWIEDYSGPDTKAFVQYLVSESLLKTSLGQLEIISYDSSLSGVFSPFSKLTSGENKIMRQITSEEELYNYLVYLKEQIRGVQNIIQGRYDSLTQLRKISNEAIESYKLVVLYADVALFDDKVQKLLRLLLAPSPAAGISFLIISPLGIEGFDSYRNNFQILRLYQKQVELGEKKAPMPTISIEEIGRRNDSIIHHSTKISTKTVSFSELPILTDSLKKVWTSTSEDGLTFSIGKHGLEPVNITIGDELNQRHNILITGAVGQGKSNLISVIIHSLCQNYSPRELSLFLLDFKEGVTLKPFSNIGKEDYLPHAKALGLESDVSFGKSVLDYLYKEYRERLALFKKVNLKNFKEFREYSIKNSDSNLPYLPRIVVIIDEFQLMFGEEATEGREIADYLEKSVRLFRAAGIHFILASQTIGSDPALLGRMDSIFSQVPIRIAHKNSISESQMTLGQGNLAASFLKPREAIVNLDYGEISQNKKVFVAYADEKILGPLRIQWWNVTHQRFPAPIIFDGSQSLKLLKDVSTLKGAKSRGFDRIALLGQEISVHRKYIKSKLKREIGNHIAIIGASDASANSALGMLQAMAISLAFLNKDSETEFLFCNAFEEGTNDYNISVNLIKIIRKLSVNVIEIKPEDFQATINRLFEDRKKMGMLKSTNEVYIFGLGMDRLRLTKKDDFSPAPLSTFLEEGADFGLHLIGWWLKVKSLEKQAFGIGVNNELINTLIFLKIGDKLLKQFAGPFVSWQYQPNRALYFDESMVNEPISFVPYSPLTGEEMEEIIKKLQ